MEYSSAGDVNKGQQLPGLQGLPEQILDAVLCHLDARSRLQVFRTSKLLATALLRVVPRIQLTYPTQHDVIGQHLRELAPFLTEALQKRQQPKLHLTLQPASCHTNAIRQRHRAEPAAAASDAARLVARMLGAVPLCGAVDSLTIKWHYSDLPWEPEFSAALAASFPFLTSLTIRAARMSIGHLANPLLLPRLLHLDIDGITITHKGQLGRSPFIGSRLQTLSLNADVDVDGEDEFLYGLVPLPRTLIQLVVSGSFSDQRDWVLLAAAVSSLTQLQQLTHTDENRGLYESGPGPMALLSALAHLPSLHTLQMSEYVVSQEQLGALLALTQITSLHVDRFSGLTSSWASTACSWRQLEVHKMDWDSAAYLPLHSLTHPLHLDHMVGNMMEDFALGSMGMEDIEEPSIELLGEAELNLCVRNTAGLVLDGGMLLGKATVDLLTEQYLSHSRSTAQQPLHPTVASSSSHSGSSTSLASSSSPEGHITAGGPGSSSGQGGQQGSAVGAQPLMQRLGRDVQVLRIKAQGLSKYCLSSANQQALAVLFPNAEIVFAKRR
ncbi:hypothetical protein QJQ45_010627 [Haematococcus lacustris]|nr:hypothetical protein QJQ45_010627 [Haematococcus lacustris]